MKVGYIGRLLSTT